MHGSTNGAVATHNGNGHGSLRIPRIQARADGGASLFLLEHVERLSRELGQADAALDDLSTRINTLERRLAVLEGQAPPEPAPEAPAAALPELAPPRYSERPAPRDLVRLLSRLENLGLEVGRTESELDVLREEPLPEPAPAPDWPELLVAPATEEPVVEAPVVEAPVAEIPVPVVEVPAVEAPPAEIGAPPVPERMVIVYPSVAMVLVRRVDAVTEDGAAVFADIAAPVAAPPLPRIETPPAEDLIGPPIRIPASEIFAPEEAHRAFPTPTEDVLEPEEEAPLAQRRRRRRRRTLLAAAVLVAALMTTMAGVALWVRGDDGEATATAEPAVSPSVPAVSSTLEPVNQGTARVPGVYAMIASSTAGAGGPISLIGASRSEVEQLYGPSSGERPDGAVSYLGGNAYLTYSADDRVLRAVFATSAEQVGPAGAETILATYRPSDADEVSREQPEPGVERVVYESRSLALTFEGLDSAGRDPGSYVEEVRSDPSTGRVLVIILALGDTP